MSRTFKKKFTQYYKFKTSESIDIFDEIDLYDCYEMYMGFHAYSMLDKQHLLDELADIETYRIGDAELERLPLVVGDKLDDTVFEYYEVNNDEIYCVFSEHATYLWLDEY